MRFRNTGSLIAAATLLISMIACQEQEGGSAVIPPTPGESTDGTTIEHERVRVEGYGQVSFGGVRNNEAGHAEIDAVYNGEDRLLTFDARKSESRSVTLVAAIADADDIVLWEQGYGIDDEGRLVSFYETDFHERLDIHFTITGQTVQESYEWAGLEDGTKSATFRYEPESVESTAQAGAEYMAWQPKHSTLNHHPDGILLNRVMQGQVADDDVLGFLKAGPPREVEPGAPALQFQNPVCQVAAICAALKCRFGGPANTVCDTCVIIVVSCAICALLGLGC